jgi:hypothetical protein
LRPEATAVTVPSEIALTGLGLDVNVPFPSCPRSLYPADQTDPSDLSATEWLPPRAIAVIEVRDARVGVFTPPNVVVVPLAS